jgi:hypothetical protein
MGKYYNNYDSLETYLKANPVVLFKVLITETSFVNNGRPIAIYVPGRIYLQNGTNHYKTFREGTTVDLHTERIGLIENNDFLQ